RENTYAEGQHPERSSPLPSSGNLFRLAGSSRRGNECDRFFRHAAAEGEPADSDERYLPGIMRKAKDRICEYQSDNSRGDEGPEPCLRLEDPLQTARPG